MSEMCSLPIINLAKTKGPNANTEKNKLFDALTKTGFFYLEGIEGYNSEMLLKQTKWFFSQEESKKMALTTKMFNKKARNCYRGYFPVQPNETSQKEGFEIGPSFDEAAQVSETADGIHKIFYEKNQWPQEEIDEGNKNEIGLFKENVSNYYELMTTVGIELLSLIAQCCNAEPYFFSSLFCPVHLSTLRLLHYPGYTEPSSKLHEEYILQCSEHKDSGFVTLLSTFHYPGLQIKDSSGSWIDVPSRPNSLVVNIGELLSSISVNKFKATMHRVVNIAGSRYSVPFFLEPIHSADVNLRLPVGDGVPQSTDKVLYGTFLFEKMLKFAEYKNLFKTFAT